MNAVLKTLLILSFAWVIFNQVYVYLFLNGAKSYRIESALFIFAFLALVKFFTGQKSETPEPEPRMKPTEYVLLASAAFLCWLAISVPLLRLPFLSDDYVFLFNLDNNFRIYQTGVFFRPVFNVVFGLMIKIFGPSSSAFHALNFLLHLSNSYLIYLICIRLFSSRRSACLVAVLFLLNPIQPEAVVWISGLQELLWVFFILLATLLYIQNKEIEFRAVMTVTLLVILALLSKETAIVFVILFPVLDAFLFGFKRGKKHSIALASFFVLFIVYLVVRTQILSIPSDFISFPSLYFIKFFLSEPFSVFPFPWNQALYGNLPVLKFFLSLILVALFWYLSLRARISEKMALGFGLIFIGIFPLYRLLDITSDLQGSRYLYFSAFGWAALLSFILLSVIRRRTVYIVLTLCLILVSSIALYKNLAPWKEAGRIIESLPENISEEAAPDNYFGAYILRNGYREYRAVKNRLK